MGSPDQQITVVLRQIQNDLFDAGADLSTPVVENPEYPPLRITQAYIDRLEAWCDEFNEPLPAAEFVHPAGRHRHCRPCCTSRARCRAAPSAPRGRRCEVIPSSVSVLPAKYLNRLSDLLFILSRVANPGRRRAVAPRRRACREARKLNSDRSTVD